MRLGPWLVLLAGCGAGSSPGKDDSAAIATQLATVSGIAFVTAQQSIPNDGPPPSTSTEKTVTCAGGGSAGLAGDLNSNVGAGGTGSYSLDLMTTFTDCNLGTGLVLNSAPYLSTTGTVSFLGGGLAAGTVTFSGAVAVGVDTCNIDVAVQLTSTPNRSPRTTGTICGYAVTAR